MTKQELIQKTVEKLNSLSEGQVTEVADFTDFLCQKYNLNRVWTAHELLKLSMEERNKILKAQSLKAEEIYKDAELIMEIADAPTQYE